MSERNLRIGLIVCALVGVAVVLLRLPAIDRFRLSAYESAAVASLRNIHSANAVFAHDHPESGYASALGQLASSAGVQKWAIDSALAGGQKRGYTYRYIPHLEQDGKVDAYEVFADPIKPTKYGTRHFSLDQTGTIHVSDTAPASKPSNSIN